MLPDPAPGWQIVFDAYQPDDEPRREAILALGNGVFVTRAALIDSRQDALHYPGTYRAGCYDRVVNTIAGEQDETESLVNLPNWLPLDFRIDSGPWWRLDEVRILQYTQLLDLRTGIMRREVLAQDDAGRRTRLCEERLVSMADARLCGLRLTLTPVDWSGEVAFRAWLDAGVVNAGVKRFEDYQQRHLHILGRRSDGAASMLEVRTSDGGAQIALAQRLRLVLPAEAAPAVEDKRDPTARLLQVHAREGMPVAVEKLVALCSSLDPGERPPSQAAQRALQDATGFADLLASHRQAWNKLWEAVALEPANPPLARALRFHAFHILQAVSPHSAARDAGIPARGWHEGYHGHVFWDELFVLPFLNFRFPDLARDMLMYRWRRLPAARNAARAAGLRGAMYPWRSAGDGREVTPRHQKNLLNGQWMRDHTYLQRHIGSAIAFNIWHYHLATGDEDFLVRYGAEMMLEIARFWASIAQPSADGDRYEICGVIGPDEYHNAYPWRSTPGLDNNAYTNLMAVWTLCRAREMLDDLPAAHRHRLTARLGIGTDELSLWERISRRMTVRFHGDGIISQFEGFERLAEFHPEMLPASLSAQRTDWALNAIGKRVDAYQVTKQADVLALFYLLDEETVIGLLQRLGYAFDHDAILRTARYYLPRTVHRSSLSRIVYGGALARLDPGLSWDLYQHALETDLNPLKGESVAEGIHLGAMGGTIDILQRRYLGIAATPAGLAVDPAPPPGLGDVRMRLRFRGRLLEVAAEARTVTIRSCAGNGKDTVVLHRGQSFVLSPGASISLPAAVSPGPEGRP
jgi:alpha,alpha-trehalase